MIPRTIKFDRTYHNACPRDWLTRIAIQERDKRANPFCWHVKSDDSYLERVGNDSGQTAHYVQSDFNKIIRPSESLKMKMFDKVYDGAWYKRFRTISSKNFFKILATKDAKIMAEIGPEHCTHEFIRACIAANPQAIACLPYHTYRYDNMTQRDTSADLFLTEDELCTIIKYDYNLIKKLCELGYNITDKMQLLAIECGAPSNVYFDWCDEAVEKLIYNDDNNYVHMYKYIIGRSDRTLLKHAIKNGGKHFVMYELYRDNDNLTLDILSYITECFGSEHWPYQIFWYRLPKEFIEDRIDEIPQSFLKGLNQNGQLTKKSYIFIRIKFGDKFKEKHIEPPAD